MGRLVPNKNFTLLVEAFRLCGAPGTLVILGKGPLREHLLGQIETAGLSGRVVLAGFQANPFAWLAKADCFVLPSNGEGFPNGLVEAMILGVPVISTNCPSGPAEILDDQPELEIADVHEGRYGLLVPMNAPAALARALTTVLAPDQRERRGQLSQAGAARYDMAGTLRTYWRVILGEA
jgi:N-acetylgalactosamine-N,N'-diacetylbacillosaminyl-diphospho-undecaprenol 4-alpha-N-acetylgalactosaminyltransferase